MRELEGAVTGGAFRAQYEGRSVIQEEDLSVRKESRGGSPEASFSEQVHDFKLKLINDALSRFGGNQVKAAGSLGLDRSTMRRILARN